MSIFVFSGAGGVSQINNKRTFSGFPLLPRVDPNAPALASVNAPIRTLSRFTAFYDAPQSVMADC